MYYTIYTDAQGYWRWNLQSGNHEIIAHGEAYHNKADCLHVIELVKSSANATVYE